MADRYWIGGTGTWNSSNTANWSATSGGAGGASVPTSADDVYFDGNSDSGAGFTVTVAPGMNCKNFNANTATPLDQAMILAGSAQPSMILNIFGDTCSFPLSNFSVTQSPTGGQSFQFIFQNTSSDLTFTSNGVILPGPVISNCGLTRKVILGSALTCSTVEFRTGIFDTGNYDLTCTGSIQKLSFGVASEFIMGSSTITCVQYRFFGGTHTVTPGTSNFSITGSSPSPEGFGPSANYYNVSFTNTSLSSLTITNSQTFNNLTFASRSSSGFGFCTIGANQTINGTLTIQSGNTDPTRRIRFNSNTAGVQRTITAAAVSFGSGIDFQDIAAAGAASPFNVSALQGGDCKGNSNITFPAAKTVYRIGTGNFSVTQWASSSGGSPAADQFPLAQDTMVFDANTTTGTHTINAGYQLGTLTMTNSTTVTLASGSTTPTFYGDITLSNAVTPSGTGILTLSGRTTQTITSSGRTFTQPLTIDSPGGSVQLADALLSSLDITLTRGTVDLGNQTATCRAFLTDNSNTRSIAFGTGKIITKGTGTVWNSSTVTGLTVTGTPVVDIDNNTATATTVTTGALSEANSISFNFINGTYTLTDTAAVYRNLNFTGFAGTIPNSVRTIFGNLTISSGMTLTAGANATTFAATSGTQQITTAGKTLDFPVTANAPGATVQLQDNLTQGTTRTFTLTAGSIDLSNGNRTLSAGLFSSSNSNTRSIAFGTGALTVTGSGTVWNTGTVTGFTRTGTPTVNISNNSATATTVTTGAMSEAQALNFNYTTGTYTLTDTAAVYRNLNFTGFAGTVPNSVRTLYGGLTLEGGATNSAGANATTFAATSGTHQINTDGVTIDYPLVFNGNGGTFEFQDALTQGATRAFTITAGTVELLAGATSTVGSFGTSGATQKFLLSTTPGVQATLSQASGTVNVSNLTIQDSNATGGAIWRAYTTSGNVDDGNNDGWDFSFQTGKYIYTRRKNKRILP